MQNIHFRVFVKHFTEKERQKKKETNVNDCISNAYFAQISIKIQSLNTIYVQQKRCTFKKSKNY